MNLGDRWHSLEQVAQPVKAFYARNPCGESQERPRRVFEVRHAYEAA